MSDPVLCEVQGSVLRITLNRPEVMNAVDTDLAEALLTAAASLDAETALRVGVLTGAGKGFCAGMDLKAFAKVGVPKALQEFFERGTTKPLICAVEGFALAGGLELALTCDFVIAARNARFGIPEVGVGLFAAGGALLRLPRHMPYGIALQMALTGDPITAEYAHRHGLVSHLAEPGEAVYMAMDLAKRVARNAPLAVTATKQLMHESQGRTDAEFWRLQAPILERIFSSNDAREGTRAFAEKRPASWCAS